MTWVDIAQTLHDCPLPNAKQAGNAGYPVNSVWKCDDCGQMWGLHYDGEYSFNYFFMRRGKVYVDATIKKEVLP